MPAEALDPVLGDPVEVAAAARTFQLIALEVAEIAVRLRASASGAGGWQGAASMSAQVRSATLPPKLDKADTSYAAAGNALGTYARSLSDAQQQSLTAIATAKRASADLATASAGQAAAARQDAAALATAQAAGVAAPPPTASRYQASIDQAAVRLRRAQASNDDAHQVQRNAARAAGAALAQASHQGIRNASWLHNFTRAIGHWASTQWAGALRELSKVAGIVSVLAGVAALALSIAGIFFPPLEAAAAVLESVSLVSALVAGSADTVLAATGRGSWGVVGLDALTLLPTGLAKVVTKAAPAIREGRSLRPEQLAHASEGGKAGKLIPPTGSPLAFPGGLAANEAAGGHVLIHIGLDQGALAARAIPEASTFADRASAESALAAVQSANSREIRRWLRHARPGAKIAFSGTFDAPVGQILYEGNTMPVAGRTAIAILRADPSVATGYHIVTGYVAP